MPSHLVRLAATAALAALILALAAGYVLGRFLAKW